jgi:hypothetical protein
VLRDFYRNWLAAHGKAFGEPLDHGDVEGGPTDEVPAGVDPKTGEITHDPQLTPEQVQRVQAGLAGIGQPDRAEMFKRVGITDQNVITLSQAQALHGMIDALKAMTA